MLINGKVKDYDLDPVNNPYWANHKVFVYSHYSGNKPADGSRIVWQGTYNEIYNALHDNRYRVIIEFYFRWKRGLYQLPPFADAPYYVTECFNSFSAYDQTPSIF